MYVRKKVLQQMNGKTWKVSTVLVVFALQICFERAQWGPLSSDANASCLQVVPFKRLMNKIKLRIVNELD